MVPFWVLYGNRRHRSLGHSVGAPGAGSRRDVVSPRNTRRLGGGQGEQQEDTHRGPGRNTDPRLVLHLRQNVLGGPRPDPGYLCGERLLVAGLPDHGRRERAEGDEGAHNVSHRAGRHNGHRPRRGWRRRRAGNGLRSHRPDHRGFPGWRIYLQRQSHVFLASTDWGSCNLHSD